MDRLNGKVAIVTGAGKKGDVDGTGYATSMLFAREGAKVLLADLSPENANATLAEIEAEGGEASVFIGDVSTEEACAGMVEAAVERFGKVNVLFNNVGLGGSFLCLGKRSCAICRPSLLPWAWLLSCVMLSYISSRIHFLAVRRTHTTTLALL